MDGHTSRDCIHANHGDCWETACACTCHDVADEGNDDE